MLMSNKFKMFFSLILVISLSFSYSIKISANDTVSSNSNVFYFKNVETKVINEYQSILNQLDSFSKRSTYSLYSDDEIFDYIKLVELKNTYKEYIYSLKELSTEELKSQNYTDVQINAIKNYDGSDEMTLAASAYVNVSVATLSHTSTKHGVRFGWSWIGTPLLTGFSSSDGVAVRWDSCNEKAVKIKTILASGTNAYVRYGSTKKTLSYTYKATSQSVEAKFVIGGLDGTDLSFASSGVFDVYVELPSSSTGKIAYTGFDFSYAHVTLTVNSVNFSYPLSGGIEISAGEEMTYKTKEVNT